MSDPYHIPGGELCKICGLTFYDRSMGGPGICPSCDCGNFGAPVVQAQGARIAALEARNAEQFRLMGQYMENAEAAHERIAELEAALNKAVGAFETIGFHLPKDNLEAVNEAILIARGFNAWYDSTKETACECMPLDARGTPGDLEIFCPKCGKVFRTADTSKIGAKHD
jgi:hypothetical protein